MTFSMKSEFIIPIFSLLYLNFTIFLNFVMFDANGNDFVPDMPIVLFVNHNKLNTLVKMSYISRNLYFLMVCDYVL